MTTLELLLSRYGILLDLKQVGELFHAAPGAVRQAIALRRGVGAELAPAVVRRGRKIFFRATDVAKIIDGGVLA